jgi:hypothetical protein
MNKKIAAIAIIVVSSALLLLISMNSDKNTQPDLKFSDLKNASFEIDGKIYALKNGQYQSDNISDSAHDTVINYFGNEATGDLNNDSKPDRAFLITKNDGGSGTFYYVVVALATDDGFIGTNAVLIGDRIAPQTTEIRDMVLIVNYADREEGEPMVAKPSRGISKYLKVVGTTLEAIEIKR